MLLSLVLACHRGEGAAPAAPAAPAPTPSQIEVHRALSVRDPAPDCATVAALSPDPLADLAWVADNALQPPWAGLRAAACVARLYPTEGQARLEAWVSDPDTAGLARAVLHELSEMPPPVASAVEAAALAGPHAAIAREQDLEAPAPGL